MTNLILFTLIFTAILAYVGFSLQYGKKKEIELRQQARNWPKTTGTVTGSEVKVIRRSITTFTRAFLPRRQSLDRYVPVVYYTYQVNGTDYQSSRYKNGWLSRSGEWSSILPKEVEKIVVDHPQGRVVNVVYNPQNPAQAYLELDTSIGLQRAYYLGGFVFYLAALFLLGLGAVRIGQNMTETSEDQKIPVAIPATLEEIQKNLANELQMTSCQAEEGSTHGGELTYTIIACDFEDRGKATRVLMYSRKDDPQKVDQVVAFWGSLDQETALGFYTRLSAAVVPSADTSQVKSWLADAIPAVTKDGSEVETLFSGVQFGLNNENRMGASLRIGELR